MGLITWKWRRAGIAAVPALAAFVLTLPLYAQKSYRCPYSEKAVAVDGRIDEPAWRQAPWTESFVDIQGSARPRPRFRTRVKMLWDDKNFYIGADLEEPHVWGTLREHDSVIFRDNDFEVFIDPDGDTRNYFEFEINALNTGWDLFLNRPYRKGGRADNGWEIPGLGTAVSVQGKRNDPAGRDRGWTVELAFPWSGFAHRDYRAAAPRDGDTWRVNFSRVEWQHRIAGGAYEKIPGTREDNWVWSPQGEVNMHIPEKWGFVRFVRRR